MKTIVINAIAYGIAIITDPLILIALVVGFFMGYWYA